MGQVTRGLTKIEVGAVAADGGPGITLAVLGKTDRNSPVTQVEADPTLDYLYSHEDDVPVDVAITGGERPFLFTVLDPDLACLALIFGGTVTGTGPTATYSMPNAKAIQYRTVKITPQKGFIRTIVNGLFYGKENADYAKAGKYAIDCVVQPLLPTKAATSAVIVGPVV